MNTALILRPTNQPDIHVLECDGPEYVVPVNHHIGTNISHIYSFGEFTALNPRPSRNPARRPYEIDHETACRIFRLLSTFRGENHQTRRAIREVRYRLATLFPEASDG